MPNELPIAGSKEKLLLIFRRRKAFVVQGDSMLPVLKTGDKVIVDPRAVIAVGDIVLAWHPFKQNTRLIKRVTDISPTGDYSIAGDNPDESTDSRTFGKISSTDILGKVVGRFDGSQLW